MLAFVPFMAMHRAD